ncbi:hypothetical protein MVEN_02506500 [Mycena venus]|uniref:F-box domain-containing protein n=1 Tax=Mycena venus TaxID=2733690 RepID=A0A8H6U2I1_9AGAR|nr:hypothetical protein MVEN_02506500 [Mycena venus]
MPPMLLLNICHAWTDIALSTLALWAAIDVVLPCAKRLNEVLAIWFHRARNHPLAISLQGDFDAEGFHALAEFIWQHGHQMKHLKIRVGNGDGNDAEVDVFGTLIPGPLPLLETVTIRGLIHERALHGPPILDLLRLAPNLVECILDEVVPVWNLNLTSKKLVLPNLRRLMFGLRTQNPDSDDDLLRCLSLPGLEVLSLSGRHVSGYNLFRFFGEVIAAPPRAGSG